MAAPPAIGNAPISAEGTDLVEDQLSRKLVSAIDSTIVTPSNQEGISRFG